MSSLQNVLPPTSFVPFRVERFALTNLVWQAKWHRNIDVARYCLSAEVIGAHGKLRRRGVSEIAYAERYGGEGVGSNAGGVRCGIFQGWQIKGIGRAPLAGRVQDKFHSYGGMALSEAVLEVIWSLVCNKLLPYAAPDVAAILDTGQRIPRKFPKTGGDPTAPRVLLLRAPVVRTAHYIRSSFECIDRSGDDWLHDALRTKYAAQSISKLRTTLLQNENVHRNQDDDVVSLVCEVARRAASQLSRARSLRIFHGSLTASNVGICGEWLDFTSISSLPGYGRIILPRGGPDFLNEESPVLRGIFDLVNSLSRSTATCLRDARARRARWLHHAVQEFHSEFSRATTSDIASLLGLDDCDIRKIPPSLLCPLIDSTSSLAYRQAGHPFTILSIDNDAEIVMPKMLQPLDTRAIICIASASSSIAEAQNALYQCSQWGPRVEKFLGAYFAARDFCKAHAGNDCAWVNRGLAKARHAVELDRTVLYPALEKLECQSDAVAATIDSACSAAEGLAGNAVIHDGIHFAPNAIPESVRKSILNEAIEGAVAR